MTFNKKEFLNTELGQGLIETLQLWDFALDNDAAKTNLICSAKFEIYQKLFKQLYGIELSFSRTDEYYAAVDTDAGEYIYLIRKQEDKT